MSIQIPSTSTSLSQSPIMSLQYASVFGFVKSGNAKSTARLQIKIKTSGTTSTNVPSHTSSGQGTRTVNDGQRNWVYQKKKRPASYLPGHTTFNKAVSNINGGRWWLCHGLPKERLPSPMKSCPARSLMKTSRRIPARLNVEAYDNASLSPAQPTLVPKSTNCPEMVL